MPNIQLCFFNWEVNFKSYSFGENNDLEVLISEAMLLRIFYMTSVLLLCQHVLINLAFTKGLKMYISSIQLEYLYECLTYNIYSTY